MMEKFKIGDKVVLRRTHPHYIGKRTLSVHTGTVERVPDGKFVRISWINNNGMTKYNDYLKTSLVLESVQICNDLKKKK